MKNNYSGTKITQLILYTLLLIILAGLLYKGINHSLFSYSGINFNGNDLDGYSEITDQLEVTDDISNIEIEWVSNYVNIHSYEGDYIKVVQDSDNYELSGYLIDGNTLKIASEQENYIFNISNFANDETPNLDVYIPESIDLDSIDIDVVSSDTIIEGVSSKNLTIDNVSGGLNVSGSFDNFELDTVSGSCNVDIVSENVSLDGISGNIKLYVYDNIKNIDIDSVSGDIDIFIPKEVNYVSEINDVTKNYSNVDSDNDSFCDINVDTVSGDVNINLK